MAHLEMTRSAFYCLCGYGQAGDNGIRTPEQAKGWDGKTYLDHPKGEAPKCPNEANHPSLQQKRDADRLAALEAEVAALRAKQQPAPSSPSSSSSEASTSAPAPAGF